MLSRQVQYIMKKNDIILIIALLLVSIITYTGIRLLSHSGKYAIVTINNDTIYTLPLDSDTSIRIQCEDNSYNTVVIRNGCANITEADCPDKICVNHHSISDTGETIVCLPHKLVVRISDSE